MNEEIEWGVFEWMKLNHQIKENHWDFEIENSNNSVQRSTPHFIGILCHWQQPFHNKIFVNKEKV
jgi:hypothetical protein